MRRAVKITARILKYLSIKDLIFAPKINIKEATAKNLKVLETKEAIKNTLKFILKAPEEIVISL